MSMCSAVFLGLLLPEPIHPELPGKAHRSTARDGVVVNHGM